MECLAALVMISGILLVLNGVIKQSKQITPLLQRRQEQEFETFLRQLENELAPFKFERATNFSLLLERPDGKNVNVGVNEKNKIVLSNNNGYHPLLTNVKSMRCKQNGHSSVSLTITFLDGEVRYGKWTIP